MSGAGHVRNVTPEEAAALVGDGLVRLLDVRTPGEYTALGHIPGARLLPVDLVASAPAVLHEDDRRPVLVYCEHGVRSEHASALLARAGFDVLNMLGGMSRWTGPREHDAAPIAGPSSWLLACADLLPPPGTALDVACGFGRHALLLASARYRVRALDRDPVRVAFVQDIAARLGLLVTTEAVDLETGDRDLGTGLFDLIVVTHYLHRPLFPALVRTLRPGGLLVYETFTVAQAALGQPRHPAFLLESGELPRLVAPLTVVREREGEFEGRMVAGVAARKGARAD